MILVNNPGSWAHIHPPLRHAAWHGLTPTDLVFPFFLFIVGVAISLSFKRRIAGGATNGDLGRKVVLRSLVIFVLGLFLNGFPFGIPLNSSLAADFTWAGIPASLTTLRIPGVLQRIALCYLLAGLTVVLVGRNRNRALVTSTLIIVISLFLASILSTRFAIWAKRSERLAQERLGEVVQERSKKEQAWTNIEQTQHETARRLYASQMMQATSAWEAGDYGSLEKLLQSTTPAPQSPDYRGWEWYFLNEQLRQLFALTPNTRIRKSTWNPAAWRPQTNQLAVIVEKTDEDSAIELWRPDEQTPLRTVADLPGTPSGMIRSFRWSTDGTRIAFATNQGRAVVLDVATGAVLFDQQAHPAKGSEYEIYGFDLTATGDRLATASQFGKIKLWDVETGSLVDIVFDPETASNLFWVAFSPDGQQLAVTLRYGRRTVWDLQTGTSFDYDPVADGSHGVVQWSADGSRFATTDTDKVAVYQEGIAAPLAEFTHPEVTRVCWMDGETLVSSGKDQGLRVWSLDQQRMTQSLRLARQAVSLMGISQDGQFLAVKTGGQIRLVRLTERHGYQKMLQPAERQIGTRNVVRWSNDGTRVAVAHTAQVRPTKHEHTLRVYNVPTAKLIAEHDIAHGTTIEWSMDDTTVLAVGGLDRYYELGVADPTLRNVTDNLVPNGDKVTAIAVSHKSNLLAATGNDLEKVTIYQLGSMQIRDTIEIPYGLWSTDLAWSPNGRSLAIAYVLNNTIFIQFYDAKRRQTSVQSATLVGDEPVLAWDPTSTRMAVGNDDAAIYVGRIGSLEQSLSLTGHRAPIQRLAWSPDAARLASCAHDGTVRIWDTARGDQLAVFHLPEQPNVSSVDWSPDGRQLAAGVDDGKVYVLDAGPSLPPSNNLISIVNGNSKKDIESHANDAAKPASDE